jgi:hypothetical protein
MLGVNYMNNEDYGRYMEAQVANMEPEKKEALIHAIKTLFRAFSEDNTQGVLILLEKGECMTTMGLNASYDESVRIVNTALNVFIEDAITTETETKH